MIEIINNLISDNYKKKCQFNHNCFKSINYNSYEKSSQMNERQASCIEPLKLEKKGFDFAYHSTEDLRRATKTITDFIYTDVITQKKYANFIDIWLNEDESITIQYYGVSRDKFGSSFTQTVEKYNSNTKEYLKYVFSYDNDLDKWSYQEIKNNKGE